MCGDGDGDELSQGTSLDGHFPPKEQLDITWSPLLRDLRPAVSLGDVSIPNELMVSLPSRTGSKSLLEESSAQWHSNGDVRTRSASDVNRLA